MISILVVTQRDRVRPRYAGLTRTGGCPLISAGFAVRLTGLRFGILDGLIARSLKFLIQH